MPSLIDPSRPEDGVPAVKAELRANWQAARREINHMGFFAPLVKGNAAVAEQKDRAAALGNRVATLVGRIGSLEGAA